VKKRTNIKPTNSHEFSNKVDAQYPPQIAQANFHPNLHSFRCVQGTKSDEKNQKLIKVQKAYSHAKAQSPQRETK